MPTISDKTTVTISLKWLIIIILLLKGEVDELECNAICYGNHAQKCGGGWRNSVYYTGFVIGK